MAMVYSSNDMLAFVASIHTLKAPMVFGKAAKLQDKPLPAYMKSLPEQIKKCMMAVAAVHVRYVQGDYRHEESELGKIETLAQYILDKHQEMGGAPAKVVNIQRHMMRTKEPPAAGSYMMAVMKVKDLAAT